MHGIVVFRVTAHAQPSLVLGSFGATPRHDPGPARAPGFVVQVIVLRKARLFTRLASKVIEPDVQYRVPPFLAIVSQSFALSACYPILVHYVSPKPLINW
jgi:hypothetical protein